MIEVAITDERRRPWWNPLRRRRWVLALPESWDDLRTPRHRARWWRWVLTMPAPAAQGAMLNDLLRRLPWRIVRRLSSLDMGAFARHLVWATGRADCTAVPVPEFEHRGLRYLMPRPKGTNVSCIEFAMADDYYREFITQQDDRSPLLLLATLAREAEPDQAIALRRGDDRQPLYSREETEARAARLSDAPPELTTQALLYFSGLKDFVHSLYGEWLFELGDDEEEDTDDDDDEQTKRRPARQPSDYPNFGWWGIFQQVAESGVFGHHVNEVYQAPFHDVCVHLVRKRVEQKQHKDALADMRRPSTNSFD